MKVKTEIEKFIAEYEQKIKNCEELLAHVRDQITAARKAKEGYAHLRKSQSILHAQCNAYYQAKADFDSLLDYTGDA